MNTLMYGPVVYRRGEKRGSAPEAKLAQGMNATMHSHDAKPLAATKGPSSPGWQSLPVAEEQAHVLRLMPVIARIVRSLAPQTSVAIAQEDMTQIALIAALDAVRRYGPPDERFTAYAATRIRGAVLDELRRLDWRPRTLRQASHKRRDAERELTRSLGRAPTREELSAHAGMDDTSLEAAEMAGYAESIASFDQMLDEGGLAANEALVERRSPESLVATRQSLTRALDALDEREQHVVQLYYEFDMNLEEIGEVLGVTRARICQIHQAALGKMKVALQDAERGSSQAARTPRPKCETRQGK
ncbi:FliA/WhiG family RNA polymerase sigma factor [Pandoraea fibrosis]|uniref:RNA polymerase sigma factor for flagellar operon n=1 Tax=Pandoraea fibrosis TaxID=1891094 RepID=A0A5E4V110_9BURK|nr:FliA/WhiG family RNA polymerase sigma factor [Pandoraea fibrosis]VVE05811.1 RNA polymerase sigma factor for flagellar operon [Pandoraea fibrosis]